MSIDLTTMTPDEILDFLRLHELAEAIAMQAATVKAMDKDPEVDRQAAVSLVLAAKAHTVAREARALAAMQMSLLGAMQRADHESSLRALARGIVARGLDPEAEADEVGVLSEDRAFFMRAVQELRGG